MQVHGAPSPSGKSLRVHHQGLPSHLVEQVQGLDLVMEYKVSMCARVCVLMCVSVRLRESSEQIATNERYLHPHIVADKDISLTFI